MYVSTLLLHATSRYIAAQSAPAVLSTLSASDAGLPFRLSPMQEVPVLHNRDAVPASLPHQPHPTNPL